MAKKRVQAKSKPQVVVVVSDLHAGSDCGILPPSVELTDGQIIGYGKNPWQKWLWAKWLEMQDEVKEICGGDDYILVCNGDLVEGIHHRSDEVVQAKIMEHLVIANHCMQPLASGAAKIYMTRGTECHVRDLETVLAKEWGAGKAHDAIQFRVNGLLYDVRHHMPTTSRLHLEQNAYSVTVANNRSNAARNGHEPARIFLRGHRHVHGLSSDGHTMMAVTGPWQALTRFGSKVVPDAVPRPSVIVFDHRNQNEGMLPVVHQLVYSPPKNIVIHVAE